MPQNLVGVGLFYNLFTDCWHTVITSRGVWVSLWLKILLFYIAGEERVLKAPRREGPQIGLGRRARGGRGWALRSVLVSSSGMWVFGGCSGIGCLYVTPVGWYRARIHEI